MSAQGLATLQRAFVQAPQMAERELMAAMTEATILVEREVKENIPTGATGLTRASVTSDAFSTPAGVLGVVGSSQPSALFVELGTRPHMPPVAPLVPWVRAKFGLDEKRAQSVAFLIARKIARRGTRAQRPFGRALETTMAQVARLFESAADRIASQLAGDAA